MTDNAQEIVISNFKQSPLYIKYADAKCESISASGSKRRYFRFKTAKKSFLGVYNQNILENISYIDYSKQFSNKNLPIPGILHVCSDNMVYFVEDAGQQTLFERLSKENEFNTANGIPAYEPFLSLYYRVIDKLLEFQYVGGRDFDYSKAFQRNIFDKQSMLWDLSYFKYFFLKLSDADFNEDLLEKDFNTLTDFLEQAPKNVFMSRDFQSRNIVLDINDNPYFIDFQAGRRGPAAYDLASLLFEAKANLSPQMRDAMLKHYIEQSKQYIEPDKHFYEFFYGFVFMRIFQAMGAYGLRGLYEKKTVFLQSIPFAIRNLRNLIKENKLPVPMPHLESIIFNLPMENLCKEESFDTTNKLKIHVYSFSFRKTPPIDTSGNGGGFIFDCRGLPNPGRLEEFKQLTGKDPKVINYLQQHPQVNDFINNCIELSSTNIKNYIERGFKNLYIAFACTGGQHRSVYCAEEYCKRIRKMFNISVILDHIEHPS